MTVPDLSVGDSEKPWLDVAPYQVGDTTATLTVHSPADTDPSGTAVALDAGVETTVDGVPVLRFTTTAAVQYPAAGWWVRSWTVTGVGACQPDERYFVAPDPVAGGPTWTPTRQRVAAYVPSRPQIAAADGSLTDLQTWDSSTRPTGTQIDTIIMDAVRWVTDATGTLHDSLDESANAVAAIRAAAFVELGYGERSTDTKNTANTTSDRLFKQADAMLASLTARNRAITGADGDDPTPEVAVMPVWSFPAAPSWGDSLL